MATKTVYVARWRNWQYGAQDNLDFGQIVNVGAELTHRDKRLLDLGYMSEVSGKDLTILECGECGEKFLNESDRTNHGKKRHPRRGQGLEMAMGGPIDPQTGEPNVMIDIEGDKEERQAMRETPLYLEKTEASLKG